MEGIAILPPLAALVLHAAWVLVLVVAIGVWRLSQVAAGQKRANEFPSGTEHGSEAYWRLNRAHMNTVENLPTFAALVLAGVYLQVQDFGVSDSAQPRALRADCADAHSCRVGVRYGRFVTVCGLCCAGRFHVRDGLFCVTRDGHAVAVIEVDP